MMEQLQLDLSIVKKEPHYFEDYGQSTGNILDNIIPEPDFDQFGHAASSVPNSEEMDQNVDWLSSFFDEPAHETCNVNGLNPPISKLSDIPLSSTATCPSVVKLLGSNSQNGILSESFSLITDDYTNDMVYKSPNSVRPPSPDPFLSPSQDVSTTACTIKPTNDLNLATALKKAQNIKILSQVDRRTLSLATAKELIQRLKDSQNVNVAERLREQRLGHKQNHSVPQKSDIGLIKTVVKAETDHPDCDSGNYSLLSRVSCTVPEFSSLRNGKPLCYESPSHLSPGRVPSSPSNFLAENECSNSSTENMQNFDPSKERTPIYLSEEERRTLITEGLPIPSGLPLSKVEERALKKVRRKIKNKISAQESRRKKKEYMEALEKKIEIVNGENTDLRKKVDTLENANRSLIVQLQKLQTAVAPKTSKESRTKTTQTIQSMTI